MARSFKALAIACLVIVGTHASAQTSPKTSSQISGQANVPNWALGEASAPVTLMEYGSLTCGGCAAFATQILPNIKRRFITRGRVRYIFRASPTPPFDLSVAMHALTYCAGPSRYYALADAFFERQRDVFSAAAGETGPKGTLFAIAEDFGALSYSASEACLRDPSRQGQVRASANMATAAGVASTPTFFVNNVIVTAPAGTLVTEALLINAIETALRNSAQNRPPSAKTKAKKR